VEDEIVKVSTDAINNQLRPISVEDVSVKLHKNEKPHTSSSSSSSSVSMSALLNPIRNTDMLQNEELYELKGKNLIQTKGGYSTKNKTKKRRTKNNKRKTMKHKKRRTKKNRKHKK
jgi:hypothetical protein